MMFDTGGKMPYSECPVCGFRFSWFRKWKLSTTKPYACSKCHTGLLKNADSERKMNLGIIIMLYPPILLMFIAIAKRTFHFTIPDVIELPLCILIAVPPVIIGFIMVINGLLTAKFELFEDSEKG
jgi:hypothetical protein